MTNRTLDHATRRRLEAILRVELEAVQQHFIHVLMLKAWGDDDLAAAITAVDEVDLPNAMRLVDLLVEDGAAPALAQDPVCFATHMPKPGGSPAEIIASELRLERRLTDVLRAGRNHLRCTACGAEHLIHDPLAARDSYGDWLQRQSTAARGTDRRASPVAGDAREHIDQIFAHLLVAITQGLVHAFVHWHGRRKELADAAWAASTSAMMLATDMTNHLAARRQAPDPASAAQEGHVPLPSIQSTSMEAETADRNLAEQIHAAADRATEALSGSEFGPVRRSIATYFWALSRSGEGHALPQIHNPCRDFERVLREYVRDGDRAAPARA